MLITELNFTHFVVVNYGCSFDFVLKFFIGSNFEAFDWNSMWVGNIGYEIELRIWISQISLWIWEEIKLE